MNERRSGILMHVSSLPSDYGIGTLGLESKKFVDFLSKSGQSYWQILPLGPTGFGNSPYQSFSSFAGNPLLIDLEEFIELALLDREELEKIDWGHREENIDFDKVNGYKIESLKKIYANIVKNKEKNESDEKSIRISNLLRQVNDFGQTQFTWLEDYSLYMALKEEYGDKPWQEWPADIKIRNKETLIRVRKRLRSEINFWKFVQCIFYKQWIEVKEYANKKGISIIGDIPIYVATDSADTWSNSHLFYFDDEANPTVVAGCPPDAFSDDGQLWGNPIYRWDEMEKNDFAWWIDRLQSCMVLYDIVRIDHFRGFDAYWEIPYGDETARGGLWVKGPGEKFINAINEQLKNISIIAEDLGFLTPSVIKLRENSGYPGMKVLQFAFDPREESDYLPHNYNEDSVVYTGTHDNDTILGWIDSISEEDREFAIDYLKLSEEEGYDWGLIRGAWSSVSKTSIAQMQDFLGLGSEARMNIPSTIGINWMWRAKKTDFNDELAEKIARMTKLYGRIGKKDE